MDRSLPDAITKGTDVIITKSKHCTQCPGKVRLAPLAEQAVHGQTRTIQPRICPECGQTYLKSRQDLALLRTSTR